MKKKIRIVIFLFMILSFSILILSIASRIQSQNAKYEGIKVLPEFTFYTLEGKSVHSEDFQEGPLLIILFHPECEHCRYEITEVLKSRLPGKVKKIILVSTADAVSQLHFFEEMKDYLFPNVLILVDTRYESGKLFGSDISPSTFLYNENMNLIKVFYGEVTPDNILTYYEKEGTD